MPYKKENELWQLNCVNAPLVKMHVIPIQEY